MSTGRQLLEQSANTMRSHAERRSVQPITSDEHEQRHRDLRLWANNLALSFPEIGLLHQLPLTPGLPALSFPVRRLWWSGLYIWTGAPMPHDSRWFDALSAQGFKCVRVLDTITAQIEIEKYLRMDSRCEPVSRQEHWPKEAR
jgi:hypothetical protein